MDRTVDVRVSEGVATVRIDRPDVRNCLDEATLYALAEAFRRVAGDRQVRVVVLTGSDPAFCAGLDLVALAADPDRLMAAAMDPATNPWDALRAVPQPVIGAVNGAAVTGGLELALACDFLIASERARFGDTHARVGVLPAQGLPSALAAAVGAPTAKYMSLTGRIIDAAEALRIGLVVEVVPHEDLLAATARTAAAIRGGHAGAIGVVKRQYDDGLLGTRATWWERERREAAAWQFDAGIGQRAAAARGRPDNSREGRR